MATQGQNSGPGAGTGQTSNTPASHRPTETLQNTQSTSSAIPQDGPAQPSKKRRNHRANKKKKQNRRESFLPDTGVEEMEPSRLNRNIEDPNSATARPPFYRLGQSGGRNLSETSLASEALLDHRYAERCNWPPYDTHSLQGPPSDAPAEREPRSPQPICCPTIYQRSTNT